MIEYRRTTCLGCLISRLGLYAITGSNGRCGRLSDISCVAY